MVWNAIKGAIFEEEPTAGEQPAPSPAPAPSTTGQPMHVGSTVNPEFVAAIKKAVFGRPTALTSLVEAAEKLANIIPDPTTRFKAAYATAGSGRTVQQIAAAADIHLADVEGEEMRFKAAVDAKLGTEIQQLESIATNSATQITQLQRQLEEIQQRIIQLTQQQAEASANASQKKMELQLTSDQFKAAAQIVRNEIQALRTTVTSALS